MQIFLLFRLITLTVFTLFQLSTGILSGLVVFSKGNLIMGSQFAPVLFYELAFSLLAVIWVPAMLIIDFTTQSSPTSKIKIELIWLSLLSIFLLGGSTALTAILPFPKFELLSEELMWMGKVASDRLFQAQVLSWIASLLLLFHLIPLLVLCLIHANSCPHLLDWPIKEFDWFPLPSKSKPNPSSSFNSSSTPSMVEAQPRRSISQLPLTLSAAPPGRQQQQQQPVVPKTNAFSSPSFSYSRALSTNLSPALSKPPPALNFHRQQESRQESLAGMSFFLQSPETPPQAAQPQFKSARERREEQDRERERKEREAASRSIPRTRELAGPQVDRLTRTESAGSDETGNAGVRMFDPENPRRRFYGDAGWSNDV
ncbi:hypothetical protein BDY24DRAFT_444169 [Mrakia frigida]|uniref:uncharacterized protein n=1 Tax=Mrakia frigida TaxID=29902 RepID=UPI003FCC1055